MVFSTVIFDDKKKSSPKGVYMTGEGGSFRFHPRYGGMGSRFGDSLLFLRDCLKYLANRYKGGDIGLYLKNSYVIAGWVFEKKFVPKQYRELVSECKGYIDEFRHFEYEVKGSYSVHKDDYLEVSSFSKDASDMEYVSLSFG